MGFNLAGVVIDKNYQDNVAQLSDELGLPFKYQKDISYGEAFESYKNNDTCDFYFSKNGTIIFTAEHICTRKRGNRIPGQKVLTFIISEFAMAFEMKYFSNDDYIRKIIEFDGNRIRDDGEPLPQEKDGDNDTSSLIFSVIEDVLGEELGAIDVAAKAYRYLI